MAIIGDILQRLEEVKGDTRAQSALATEFLVTAGPKEEQEPLRAALDAAAVLHWFDAELLEEVLEVPNREARHWFETLKSFSFVERYRGEGDSRFNLHEATRLGWRTKLAIDNLEHFRALSTRASSHFAKGAAPADRIEWIYHLLCGDPDTGAAELEELDRRWAGSARPEDLYALATVLEELADTQLTSGRARARSLLMIAWARDARGASTQLAEIAAQALNLAREAGDEFSEAEAICLRGDVLRVQGNFPAAQHAFDEFMTISRRHTEQDPNDAKWQRNLAAAYNRVGTVSKEQHELKEAQAAFANALSITEHLVQDDQDNAGLKRELVVAHSRLGEAHEAQGELPAAQTAFANAVRVSQSLLERDRSNTGWQRELAGAYGNLGDVLRARGEVSKAQEILDQSLEISRRLAEQDSSNADLLWDLAWAHRRVGEVLKARGELVATRAEFEQSLAISRRLADQDPGNADWQNDLAAACSRCARIEATAGKNDVALPLYEESLSILATLVERAPENLGWMSDKKSVEAELTELRATVASSQNSAANGGKTL